MQGKPGFKLVQIESGSNRKSSSSSSSWRKNNFWSLTFGITTFPFFFWGCPFYLLTGRTKLSSSKNPKKSFNSVSTTQAWWIAIFDCCNVPISSILSLLLLIPTVVINGYVGYVLGSLFNSLFIAGSYKISSFFDIVELIRYLPIVVPLDYVWFCGFRINNIVCKLNKLCRKYEGVGCSPSFQIKLVVMIILVIAVHIIRYIAYEKYEVAASQGWWNVTETILEFSLDLFSSFLLPLYCTFCYSIMFQMYVIKAYIYRVIGERELPNIMHLSVVKALYTQVADSILQINQMFSLYLSAAMSIMIFGTVLDAQGLWKGLVKAFGGSTSEWLNVFKLLAGDLDEDDSTTDAGLTASDIREINADIACILILYGMIFFTVRQAIGTNDCVREINIWLNDFVTGGGGTDVVGILQSLGALKDSQERRIMWNTNEDTDAIPLVWAKSTMTSNGMDDEFLRKFRNLKAYIHVRMQVEKPALLRIALVGMLAPSMSGRLRNYRIMF